MTVSIRIAVAACLAASLLCGAEPSELVRALAGEDAVARFLAEEKLVETGDAALRAVGELAKSPGNTPARQYAINVLARIGSGRAVRLLCDILEREQDVMARGVICQHLGRLGVEEAVPLICKWLLTIEGKPMGIGGGDRWGNPKVVTRSYAWVRHVHALREIGSEKAIPTLERLQKARNGGRGGQRLMRAYRDDLRELRRAAAFWRAVRRMPGLETEAKLLFRFFRSDTLALIRLYRDKVIGLGTEGRWVLEDLQKHDDAKLRRASAALLKHYNKLRS